MIDERPNPLPGMGDSDAESLLALVYDELKRRAASVLRGERADHTLQATALVHEAFFKLVEVNARSFESRAHFLGIATRAMRQVLIDHARKKGVAKRGGDRMRVTLNEPVADNAVSAIDLVALDGAMTRLEAKDPRMASVFEMRTLGGMTIAETAQALGVSHTTVEQDWAFAKAWLARELADEGRA